jgi:regulatory protein
VKVFDAAAARQKAYRLLSLRPHSEKELRKKLREKGFSPAIISETLDALRKLNYLDDESFARRWATSLAANKLWGNKKIIFSLREKGIDAALIERALQDARQDIPEDAAIESIIRKKTAGKKADFMDNKEKRRIFQSLLGRGFPAGLILRKLGDVEQGDFDDDEG